LSFSSLVILLSLPAIVQIDSTAQVLTQFQLSLPGTLPSKRPREEETKLPRPDKSGLVMIPFLFLPFFAFLAIISGVVESDQLNIGCNVVGQRTFHPLGCGEGCQWSTETRGDYLATISDLTCHGCDWDSGQGVTSASYTLSSNNGKGNQKSSKS